MFSTLYEPSQHTTKHITFKLKSRMTDSYGLHIPKYRYMTRLLHTSWLAARAAELHSLIILISKQHLNKPSDNNYKLYYLFPFA